MSKTVFSNYKKFWVAKPVDKIPSSLGFDDKILGNDSNSYILDIGCGNGKLLQELYQKGYTHLYGVDINLNQNNSIDSDIFLSKQDATRLNFNDDMFDVIVMKALLTVLITDHSIYKSLSEAYRVLKSNGKIIIMDFFQNWHIPVYRDRYLKNIKDHKTLKCIFPVYDDNGNIRYYARHYNTQEISLMLTNIGFKIEKLEFHPVKTQSGNDVIGFTILAIKEI